ncbi:MAG: DNA starvation/stationary phase protection protein, partial [Acidobacteria bacterium]
MSSSGAHPQKGVKTSVVARASLSSDAVAKISNELRQLLADVFALYLKTKN